MNGEFFRLISLPGKGLCGFATSRAIGCHAKRNYHKRRARAAFNEICQQNVGLDIAVVISNRAEKVGYEQLKADLRVLLEETEKRWAEKSGSE